MRIELQGCAVRSWEPADAPSIALYANNRAVWRNMRDAFPHPYTEADAEDFLRMAASMEEETYFAIEVEGKAAGGIGFRPGHDVERVSAEIGYWLGEPFWGRGIATEALTASTRYAFGTFDLTRLFALPFEWNRASCRVLEKAGYELDCVLKRAVIKDGRVIDQFLYSRTRR